jgi:hypothetical protein
MKRPTCTPRNQLALFLEPQAGQKLDAETREALITALADLLLEAYGVGGEADREDQEGCDEH